MSWWRVLVRSVNHSYRQASLDVPEHVEADEHVENVFAKERDERERRYVVDRVGQRAQRVLDVAHKLVGQHVRCESGCVRHCCSFFFFFLSFLLLLL